MAEAASQKIVASGLEPVMTAAAASQTVRAGEDKFLHVVNGGGSPITLTITTPNTDPDGNAIADLAVVVTNGEERMIGALKPALYGSGATQQVTLTWSATTSVTFACLQLP